MKKQDLYNLIKQIIKEEKQNKSLPKKEIKESTGAKSLWSKLKEKQRKVYLLENLKKSDLLFPKWLKASKLLKEQATRAGLSATDSDTVAANTDLLGLANIDGQEDDVLAGNGSNGCAQYTDYGTLTVFNGDCGANDQVTFTLNDGFICCAESNNSGGEQDMGEHEEVMGVWPSQNSNFINGLEVGSDAGVGAGCYCPGAVLDGNGNLGFDPEYREDLDSLQSKLEPILDACECQAQKDTYNKLKP